MRMLQAVFGQQQFCCVAVSDTSFSCPAASVMRHYENGERVDTLHGCGFISLTFPFHRETIQVLCGRKFRISPEWLGRGVIGI